MNGSHFHALFLLSSPCIHKAASTYHFRLRTPTIRHVSSQHGSHVGQRHSISPSAPRGWVTLHKHRIGSPKGTFRSRRSMACRCPARGNQPNGRDVCSSAAYIREVPPARARLTWSAPRAGATITRTARLAGVTARPVGPSRSGGGREGISRKPARHLPHPLVSRHPGSGACNHPKPRHQAGTTRRHVGERQ